MITPTQTGVAPVPTPVTNPASEPAPDPGPEVGEEPRRGLNLSITPNEGNAGPGEDRSNNAVTVTLTTPNRELSTEIRREDAINRLEQAANRRDARELLENSPRLGPPPAVELALRQSESADEFRETAVQAIELQTSVNTARTALDQSQLTNSDSDARGDGNDRESSNDIVEIAQQSLQAQIRQARFEARLDQAENRGSRVDLRV